MRRDPPIPLDDLTDALDLVLREGFDLDVDGEVYRVRELRRRSRAARPDASPSRRPARRTSRPGPRVAVEVEEKAVPLKLASQVPAGGEAEPPSEIPSEPQGEARAGAPASGGRIRRLSIQDEPLGRPPPGPPPAVAPVDLSEEKLREVLALAPEGARLDLLAKWFSVPEAALRPALDALVRAGLLVRPEEGSYALNDSGSARPTGVDG